MARDLSIRITATEGASKVLSGIAKSADTAAASLQKAGKDGAKGLDDLGSSAETSATSLDKVGVSGTAIGAAIGTAATAITTLGSSFKDQERQISGITALYGDSADAILLMSDNLQDVTKNSDDAGRQSALLASSLSTNYDLSAESIATLVSRSADLAQIFNMDLPSAVQRTSSAIRGEGESAEILGLNMSDAAIAARALNAGITNWNVPGALSEAEKAAFRFQIFMQDTEKTVGAAADAADTAGGKFRMFMNDIQDVGQQVGGFLGPVGEVAAELAPISLALPLIGGGLGKMGAGAKAASTAVGALGLLTNPLALGVVAIGGALTLAAGLFLKNRHEAEATAEAWDKAALSSQSLDEQILSMAQSGEFAQSEWAKGVKAQATGIFDSLTQQIEQQSQDRMGGG